MEVVNTITVAATAPAGYTLILDQAVGQVSYFGQSLQYEFEQVGDNVILRITTVWR